jgi:hypothetical protein
MHSYIHKQLIIVFQAFNEKQTSLIMKETQTLTK